MKKLLLVSIITLFTHIIFAQKEEIVQVGGAPIYPSKNIVENAVNSKDHTTLVSAIKTAGLVETLQSVGPFTLFAPVNKAFESLSVEAVDNLLKPENKEDLTKILTYHIVAGKYNTSDLKKLINEDNGMAELSTVAGGKIWIMVKGDKIAVKDGNDGVAYITIKDVNQSNGVIHVVDHVLLPQK